MKEKVVVTQSIERALSWAYDAALAGGVGFDSVEELAASYASKGGTPREQAQSLVNWQCSKAAAVGFMAGLPGLPLLPATLPTNIAAVLVIQLRMAAAVAELAGYDPRDDQVRVFATACLVGNSANAVLKGFGVKLAQKVAGQAVKQIPGKVLISINKQVGLRLVTKFGHTGLINFGKMIPFIGALVGGTFDWGITKAVGVSAIQIFHEEKGA